MLFILCNLSQLFHKYVYFNLIIILQKINYIYSIKIKITVLQFSNVMIAFHDNFFLVHYIKYTSIEYYTIYIYNEREREGGDKLCTIAMLFQV